MDHQDPNYGRYRGSDDSLSEWDHGSVELSSMSRQDENTWSALSHASVLLWPLTGLLPVAPLIVWLLYRDRSPRIAFHALQSLWYQVAWLVIFVAAGTVGSVLGFILIIVTLGLALFPLALVAMALCIFPFAHQLYAAYRSLRGHDYRYPFIADRIDGGNRDYRED